MKNKRLPALTRKQVALQKAVIANPKATLQELADAADYAGPSKVHRALRTPSMQKTWAEIMAAHPKLKRTALAKKLAEGLDAKKTQYFSAFGKVVSQKTDTDYLTRKAYLDLAARLDGGLREEGDKSPAGGVLFDEAVLDKLGYERIEKTIIERITRLSASRKAEDTRSGE